MALVLLFPVVFGGMARDIAYAQETLPQTQTDSKWYQNFEHAGEGVPMEFLPLAPLQQRRLQIGHREAEVGEVYA